MVRRHNHPLGILLPILAATSLLPHTSSQEACSSRSFTAIGKQHQIPSYAVCNDLPDLSSAIHYTYDNASSTLNLAFAATPPSPNGWVSWGINPAAPKMLGTQTLVAYRDADGTVRAATYNVSVYDPVVPGPVGYEVKGLRAEAESGGAGEIRLFATMKLPPGTAEVFQVWQVGPGVGPGGKLVKHAFKPDNMRATGTLNLLRGEATSSSGSGGTGGSKMRDRNIHGLLNAISWGFLLPLGAIIARYLKSFTSSPTWFYLHVACQITGYALGTAGWATGLKLGSQSKGVTYTTHRSVGIALFAIATSQLTALFLRPKPDHKYRYLWNALHHTAGYAVIVLGVFNVFTGINILAPPMAWKVAFITVVCALAAAAAGLEAASWCVKSRESRKTGKGGASSAGNGNGNSTRESLNNGIL